MKFYDRFDAEEVKRKVCYAEGITRMQLSVLFC